MYQGKSLEALLQQMYREAEASGPLLEGELGVPWVPLSAPTFLSPQGGVMSWTWETEEHLILLSKSHA